MAKRTMISQLASVSEGAFGKTFQVGMALKERVERMVHAITELDDRVASLEKRVDALEKPKRTTTARKTTTSKTAASKSTAKPRSTSKSP
jgi:phage shock protein A